MLLVPLRLGRHELLVSDEGLFWLRSPERRPDALWLLA